VAAAHFRLVRPMTRYLVFLLLAFTFASARAEHGYGPWRVGMTKEQVTAVSEFGPYKSVPATGGVETFNAQWNGRKTNISFVFERDRLVKIQIWAYEGKDFQAATRAWRDVRSYLEKKYGEVQAEDPKVLAVSAPAQPVKVQMGPRKMPSGLNVFSSFFRHPQFGYYVFLYYTKA
jgi:hypothetical protein